MDSLQQPGSSSVPLSITPNENKKCSKLQVEKSRIEIPMENENKTCSYENIANEEENVDACHTDADLCCRLQVTGLSGPVDYEALSSEQIVQHMEDIIEEARSVLPLPPVQMRVLLNHYKWNKESLLDAFVECGDVEKLLHNVGIDNSNKNEIKDEIAVVKECQICCSLKPSSEMFGVTCGHVFCTDCWSTYLRSQIMEEGMGFKISCIGYKCTTFLDDQTVMKLVTDLDVRIKYKELVVSSFVQSNPNLMYCPSPGCTKAIKVNKINEKDPQVKCDCGHVFCFLCGGDAHAPVTCDLMEKWNKKRRVEYESLVDCKDLIALNVKQCPNCKGHVEKTGGCNIVKCKNSSCGTIFCWVCLQPWATHNRFKCSHFEAQATMKKSEQESRADLQRFLFYINRYMAQEKSLKMEQKLYEFVAKDVHQDKGMSFLEIQFLKHAVDILCECRQTLMYTYVFAYYVEGSNQVEIFESNQNDLHGAVEKLSGIVEGISDWGSLVRVKMDVQNQSVYCQGRRRVLVDHVYEGYKVGEGGCGWRFNEG